MEDIAKLSSLDIHCAVGMSIYTGRLDLAELAALQRQSALASPDFFAVKLLQTGFADAHLKFDIRKEEK